MMQILLHATNTSVDTHVVVIQDDKQIVWCTAHIINAFESKSATHTSITNHGHNLAFVVTLLMSGNSHS